MSDTETLENAIAIIGMSGRFPKARTLEEFWQRLCAGEEMVTFFTDQELLDEGVDPALLERPEYVKAFALLEDEDLFDASFFGYSPREAEVIDPQQRLFLTCAWEALESAGYLSETYKGRTGVFAGVGLNTYVENNLLANSDFMASASQYHMMISNDKDFMCTRVSYKLDLRGPSFGVQTACSTSLVAVHVACQNLLYGECDIALAGAVSVVLPQKRGYIHRDGDIDSPDGHCRPFDAQAQGTVRGNGLGVVVLKRLEEAIASGDTIYAVIRGSAINNDGARKVGYTAPSIDGEAEAVSEAMTIADVEAESISYIEAHGTATPLGDPIELAALNQVFRAQTAKVGFCHIGSLKSNLGHLDAAAGMGGLIKTVLAFKHGMLPPSLHFEQPNPKIDFASSPFIVNTRLIPWERGNTPRRAGVSSFGIGGTNAHVVLEEAPLPLPSEPSRPWQLLMLSAKTRTALDAATDNLAAYLEQHPETPLADVAYTLQVGRKHFNHRRTLTCCDSADAAATLRKRDAERVRTQFQERRKRPVIFLFPGQGSQYLQMARGLYESESVFREQVDLCTQLLQPWLGCDLRKVIYPDRESDDASGTQPLEQTQMTQPTLFVIEYALSKLWMAWGIQPHAMIGHSVGEYVAACLAGIFSLADALFLVATRGRLMQETRAGTMLTVPLPNADLQPFLTEDLALAAINAPSLCTVSGPVKAIEDLQARLNKTGIEAKRLFVSHAFHSALMDPILNGFAAQFARVTLNAPTIPYISNLTGTWISEKEATDPHYWVRHLRQTVLFADGIRTLAEEQEAVFLEVGPGRTLSSLARQCLSRTSQQVTLASIRHPGDQLADRAFLLQALGTLWLAGVQIDWTAVTLHERRQRLPLPTYPFELQSFWVAPQSRQFSQPAISQPQEPDEQSLPTDAQPQPVVSLYARPSLSTEYVAPETLIEQRLATIWQANLGIDYVGLHDNFFEMGGHSLLVTQMVAQIQATFPIDLSLRSIFEAPTLARLAAVIEDKLLEKLEAMADEDA